MRKLLMLSLAVAVFSTIPPAQAANVGAIAFQGVAEISGGGICYPTLCGKGERGFHLNAPAGPVPVCVGAAAGKDGPVSAPSCSIDISGTIRGADSGNPPTGGLGPWCGRSQGQDISGAITLGPTLASTVTNIVDGTYESVGSMIIASGEAENGDGSQSGVWASVVNASPDATAGESCTTGADAFLVTGVAAAVVL